jgi:hypothetical protein
MAYTPPAGDNVDFTFNGGYTPPDGDGVDFVYGIVAVVTIDSVSRNKIFDDQLFNGYTNSIIRWHSTLAGPYRVEIGGDGVNTGSLVESGNTAANISIKTIIEDSDIEAATTFSGTGSYRFNIYVKSVDDAWTLYDS